MKKTEPLIPKTNSKISFFKKGTYQGIIRLLMFLIMKIKSDITFAILVVKNLQKINFTSTSKPLKQFCYISKAQKTEI